MGVYNFHHLIRPAKYLGKLLTFIFETIILEQNGYFIIFSCQFLKWMKSLQAKNGKMMHLIKNTTCHHFSHKWCLSIKRVVSSTNKSKNSFALISLAGWWKRQVVHSVHIIKDPCVVLFHLVSYFKPLSGVGNNIFEWIFDFDHPSLDIPSV